MNIKKIQTAFFFTALIICFIFFFFLLYPFIGALALALTLAIVFRPVYRTVKKHLKSPGISALLTVILILALVIIPLTFLGSKIFSEFGQLYVNYLVPSDSVSSSSVLTNITSSFLDKYLPWLNVDFNLIGQEVVVWVAGNLSSVFSSLAKVVFSFVIMIVTLFFFFKDGPTFRRQIKNLSPLTAKEDDEIIGKVELAINSVVRGYLFVAILQGLVSGTGFAVFGLPQPVLWGVSASIVSMIPGIGTTFLFIPAVAILLLSGSYLPALGLALWGVLAVGSIDLFLSPYLIKRGIKVHPLIIFFSVLGGIAFFGPIGFVLGPIILSLVFSFSQIYFSLMSESYAKKNP